jgi:hypothetical protein
VGAAILYACAAGRRRARLLAQPGRIGREGVPCFGLLRPCLGVALDQCRHDRLFGVLPDLRDLLLTSLLGVVERSEIDADGARRGVIDAQPTLIGSLHLSAMVAAEESSNYHRRT